MGTTGCCSFHTARRSLALAPVPVVTGNLLDFPFNSMLWRRLAGFYVSC